MSERVLVVDDLRDFGEGYITARSGEEAVRFLKEGQWDKMLLDYDLSGEMNGEDVINSVRNMFKVGFPVPGKVICISGNPEGREKIERVIIDIYGGLFTDYYVHSTSFIDENVIIGSGTKIWHYSHVSSGARIGVNCNIGQNVFIGRGVSIGDNVKIQNNVSVYTGVDVEDGAFLGPSCVFTNDLYPRSAAVINDEDYGKTIVRCGASIGANATIVCGKGDQPRIIGRGSLVGAGAVVVEDVPDRVIVAGNPASVMRCLMLTGPTGPTGKLADKRKHPKRHSRRITRNMR